MAQLTEIHIPVTVKNECDEFTAINAAQLIARLDPEKKANYTLELTLGETYNGNYTLTCPSRRNVKSGEAISFGTMGFVWTSWCNNPPSVEAELKSKFNDYPWQAD